MEHDPLDALLNPQIKEKIMQNPGRKKLEIEVKIPTAEQFTIKDLQEANPGANMPVLISRFRALIGTQYKNVGFVAKAGKGRKAIIYSRIPVEVK